MEEKIIFEFAKLIGVRIGGLYPLLSPSCQALFHNTTEPSEIWHRRYAHMHYKDLGILKYFVKGVSKHKTDHDGVWKGCSLGKNVKGRCIVEYLILYILMFVGPSLIKFLGGVYIMYLLLRITLEKLGFIFSRSRIKCLKSFMNSKFRLKMLHEEESRL